MGGSSFLHPAGESWSVVYVVVLLSFVKNEERKVFTITVDLWMRTGEHGADGV